MGFSTAITTCLRKYLVFSGRAPRSEYWWFFLFKLLLLGVAIFVLFSIAGDNDEMFRNALYIIGIGYLILLPPSIAVSVRRLHDWDRSGWTYLVVLIPNIGGLILLGMMIPGSSPGQNRFGPHPFDAVDYDVFR